MTVDVHDGKLVEEIRIVGVGLAEGFFVRCAEDNREVMFEMCRDEGEIPRVDNAVLGRDINTEFFLLLRTPNADDGISLSVEGEDEFARASEGIEECCRGREEGDVSRAVVYVFTYDGRMGVFFLEEVTQCEGGREDIERWISWQENQWLFRAIEEVGELLFRSEGHRRKFQIPNSKSSEEIIA